MQDIVPFLELQGPLPAQHLQIFTEQKLSGINDLASQHSYILTKGQMALMRGGAHRGHK